jgi:hypothetical protein
MLKKAPSGVLGSENPSTYPRGYACGFPHLRALLDDLFEHPALLTDSLRPPARTRRQEQCTNRHKSLLSRFGLERRVIFHCLGSASSEIIP